MTAFLLLAATAALWSSPRPAPTGAVQEADRPAASDTSPGPEPPAAVLVDGRTGARVPFAVMIRNLAHRDAVFLGEDHDNDAFHALQRDIVEALHAARPDLTVSLEMFERDTQGLLDDYLRGRIDRDAFLAEARPWGNYARHYEPVVELARELGLDVLAANVPRALAAERSRSDAAFVPGPFTARTTTAPRDAYHERFVAAMAEHMGADGAAAIERMYRAQCLKDDTMAEAIADHLRLHAHRRPLVVHLNGKFHSDHGQGTVQRVVQRLPGTSVGLVTMIAVEEPAAHVLADDERGRAHYLFLVPPATKEEPEEEAGEAAEAEGEPNAEAPADTSQD